MLNTTSVGRIATLAALNERHREFWAEQSDLMHRQILDRTTFEIANDLQVEELLRLPVAQRSSLEKSLGAAEKFKKLVRQRFARQGGEASKSDALQLLIEEIVRGEPSISVGQLFHDLCKQGNQDSIIIAVDSRSDIAEGDVPQVRFLQGMKEKTAPVSGLKDRLSRAKKKIKSR